MSTVTLPRKYETASNGLRPIASSSGSSAVDGPDSLLPNIRPQRRHPGFQTDVPVEANQLPVSHDDQELEIRPLIRLQSQTPQRRFKVLQQWEGAVIEVRGDACFAEILDLTAPQNPAEQVEIPLAEIPDGDLPLLTPGGVFYWIMGYETSPGGQIRRVSEIRVRRTHVWSQKAIDRIQTKASLLFETLNADIERKSAESSGP